MALIPNYPFSTLLKVESEEAKAKIAKLQSERETFARKLKAALLSRKELIASEKILKARNEELIKDLETKRGLIHNKDQEEQTLLDQIEVLNKTLESLKEKSKTSVDSHHQSSQESLDQLLEMKKMLVETENDVQATQRQLDQSEANNLRLDGEMASLRSENETLDACQRDLTDMVKLLEEQKLELENKWSDKVEETRQVSSRVETAEQQLEQVQEEFDVARTKAEMTDQLQKSNHELKNAIQTSQDDLKKFVKKYYFHQKKLRVTLKGLYLGLCKLEN